MEVKTKHDKYKYFKTKKQLLEEGLTPTTEGVELWINQYCKVSAIYYDTTKAEPITKVFIYSNYVMSDPYGIYSRVATGLVDQNGDVLFNELSYPDRDWLKVGKNADKWANEALNSGFSYKEILFARNEKEMYKRLIKTIEELDKVDTLISYNNSYNLPFRLWGDDCGYKKIDMMDEFARVIKEPLPSHYEEYHDDDDNEIINDEKHEYKWQKMSKFFDYYGVKPNGDKATDIANAIRLGYEKYLKDNN